MPELPDVEVMKRYLDSTALHEEIESITVESSQVLEPSSGTLEDRLVGRSLESTRRHGKYLFAEVGGDGWLVLHFGMTGGLKYYKVEEHAPEYDRLLLNFANGYHLAYTSQRKLGEVDVVDDVEDFVAEKGLGPDAMAEDFDFAAFEEAISGSRAMAKSFLMDQEVVAGIGNVYADEILFQAGIHPRRSIDALDGEERRELFDALKEVLATAIEHQADPETFPDDYIVPRREEGADCPRCEGQVERVEVSGRSAYYCPRCQPRKG